MCPPVYTLTRQEQSDYLNNWLSTALCCHVTFYERRIDGRVYCGICFNRSDTFTQRSCQLIIRHYVHIGHGELLETCRECSLVLPHTRSADHCVVCRMCLSNFTEYLHYSGDRPFDSDEPTIIAVSENRTRVHNTP